MCTYSSFRLSKGRYIRSPVLSKVGEVFFLTKSHSLFIGHLVPARDARNTCKKINQTKPFFSPSYTHSKCASLAFSSAAYVYSGGL